MTWLFALAQSPSLDTNSAISIGLMIVIITATGYISRMFTRHEAKLDRLDEKMDDLSPVPERLTKLERKVGEAVSHLEGLEDDVNTLWTTARGESLDIVRRKGRRPWAAERDQPE